MALRDRLLNVVFEELGLDGRVERDHDTAEGVVDRILADVAGIYTQADLEAAVSVVRAERDEEIARLKRGGRELGRVLDRALRDALDASGRHDCIDEDGDGDWALVWETLAELRPRAEAAEADLRALREGLEAVERKVESTALRLWSGPSANLTAALAVSGILTDLRALLAPSPWWTKDTPAPVVTPNTEEGS